MSSVTRVGFTIPAATDLADETTYYDNNITVYETELPSLVVASLPSSGNYSGRIRALNQAQTSNPPAPAMPYQEFVYNGMAWIPFASAGLHKQIYGTNPGDSSSVASTGAEVFSSVLPGFTQVNVQAGGILRFMCQLHLATSSQFGVGNWGFNGKFNIFVNPNSSGQPGPSTPGAIRLSFPMVESNNGYTQGENSGALDYFYGEMIYPTTYTGAIGVGAYLSTTNAADQQIVHDPSNDTNWTMPITAKGLSIITETAGTWSA